MTDPLPADPDQLTTPEDLVDPNQVAVSPMIADLSSYSARIRLDPRYAPHLPESGSLSSMLVVGYHAAFATGPRPGTAIAIFHGLPARALVEGSAALALVRVEYATEITTVTLDGVSEIGWASDLFGIGLPEFGWRLLPAQHTAGRWVIAPGWWSAGGRQGVLPRSITTQVPGAPTVVTIYDHDPHTGRQWSSS
ncbi:hypothetical protein OIE68_00450 [Nocardia vinacea]|uniref:hypothetical protein n=1 Tax=Nocardia vinacea TaxID=96468 RepID=UPI002E100BF7|nr:hypothetical protein OIE68_00450 [Nocardia vinacea]